MYFKNTVFIKQQVKLFALLPYPCHLLYTDLISVIQYVIVIHTYSIIQTKDEIHSKTDVGQLTP